MGDPHERYAELAVGHVLGGLSVSQSAELREHLHSCSMCRSRVAELRGIDHELAAAAREERSRVRLRTHLPPADEPDGGGAGDPGGLDVGRRIRSSHLVASVLVLLAAIVGLSFWTLHLRTAAASYLDVANGQSDALERLAEGVELDPTLATGVRGRVVTDGEHVTVTLAGLEPLEDGERLVAWLRGVSGPREPAPVVLTGLGEPRDGALAVSLPIADARELIITCECVVQPTDPGGETILEVALLADDR